MIKKWNMFVLFLLVFLTGCGKVAHEEAITAMQEQENAVWEADTEKDSGTDDAEISEETDALQSEEQEDVKKTAEEPEEKIEEVEEMGREPVAVKGIYVTGPIAGTSKMDELIALVEETELNAMVIDIKNDEGVVTYKMQSDTVLEIAAGVGYIQDIEALVKKLHEKDIYLIARIVAFKDPLLAEKKPELSLKTQTGEVFRDRNGEAWVNPYKQEVWDYLIEVGTQAAEAGFDEIQFDYIRFSTDRNAGTIDYGEEAETKTKEEVITGFAEYAYEALHPLGVFVSADVFGTIIDHEEDAEIVGQDYRAMAAHLDYICPMVYPSHYANGAYGITVPDKAPYDTVYQAMNASKEKLSGVDAGSVSGNHVQTDNRIQKEETELAGVRVWIQDFTAVWLSDYLSYGPAEVRAQIQAAYDAGYEEWILWNARMNYTEGALLPYWEEPVKSGETDENAEEVENAEDSAEGIEVVGSMEE